MTLQTKIDDLKVGYVAHNGHVMTRADVEGYNAYNPHIDEAVQRKDQEALSRLLDKRCLYFKMVIGEVLVA